MLQGHIFERINLVLGKVVAQEMQLRQLRVLYERKLEYNNKFSVSATLTMKKLLTV